MMNRYKFGSSQGFAIENGNMSVKLISYGARIVELSFMGKDVTLGFDTLEDYKESSIYCGATVGRYGNRIGNASFMLNGKKYEIDVNEHGKNTLHGGTMGFDRFEWDAEVLSDISVRFSRTSPDGEMGFPGNLYTAVTYTVEENAIKIHYEGKCDADTYFSPTNHAYFNLDGHGGEDCRNMLLQMNAVWYLPVDKELIPLGKIASVENTEFDFREMRPIAQDYDHCFVVAKDRAFRKMATLVSQKGGIGMDVESDLPSLQFYTCSGCNEKAGKGGVPLHIHHAIALETQYLPDSPNHENFPSTLLRKDELFESDTRYAFFKL